METTTFIDEVEQVVDEVAIWGADQVKAAIDALAPDGRTFGTVKRTEEEQIAEYLTNSDNNFTIYDDSPKNIMTAYYLINPKVNIDHLQRLLKQQNNYKFDNYLLKRCPQSGKKQQMFKKRSIISDACLDKDQYDKLNNDDKIEKIKLSKIAPLEDATKLEADLLRDTL